MTLIRYVGVNPNVEINELTGESTPFDAVAFATKTRTMMIDYGLDEEIAERYYQETFQPQTARVYDSALPELIKAVEAEHDIDYPVYLECNTNSKFKELLGPLMDKKRVTVKLRLNNYCEMNELRVYDNEVNLKVVGKLVLVHD